MGKYSAAAHKAAMVAEQQADQLPCAVPSNNLLYCFILEVRNMRIAEAHDRNEDPYSDNLTRNMKTALDSLREYPLRVYDAKSAQEVKGIGSAMANIIREELFDAYPPEEPGERELQQLQTARAKLRVEQAAKKRRNVIANAIPTLPAQIPRTSFGHESPNNVNKAERSAAAAALAAAAAEAGGPGRGRGRGRGRTGAPRTVSAPAAAADDYDDDDSYMVAHPPAYTAPAGTARADPSLPKPKKPYTPGIGTANYAFLIVLLQAQRGPERLEYMTKNDIMSRAEASGLSNKPIRPEAVPRGGFSHQNAQQFYSGWSTFKNLVNNGLVTVYSNPKKIKLTFEGLALAERLYRDAVARGKVSPVPGLAVDGPLLFQLDERPQSGSGAVAAAARQAQEAAGLGHGALPSAALRRPYSGAGVVIGGSGGSDGNARGPPQPRNAIGGVSAAAAAALRRASGEGSSPFPWEAQADDEDEDPLEIPLAQRLLSGRGRERGRAQQPASRLGGANKNKNKNTAAAAATNTSCLNSDGIFLDLAGDSTDEDDKPEIDYHRIYNGNSEQEEEGEDNHRHRPQAQPRSQSRRHRVSDEHVAMMMEMGFSDKKARKALRKSLGNIEDAVDIVTVMSSAGEESSSEEEEVEEERRNVVPRQEVRQRAQTANNNTKHNPATAAAGAAAAAARAGVPLSRQPSLFQDHRQGIGPTNAGRGHIRTGSQLISRPRLDLNSQSQPDYPDYAQPPSQPQPAAQPPQRQNQQNQNENQKSWWVQETEIRLPPLSTGSRFSDEYEVVLLVDGREQYSRTSSGSGTASRTDALNAHLTRMRGAGLAVEHRTLPIGDALWVARSRRTPSAEYVLDYILERKALTDLLSSIKDSNRYTSQKYFLNRSGLRNLYYLIEGDAEVLPNPRDVKTIKSAAGSTEIIDGFRVLRTKGVQETFRLYQSLTEAVVHLYSNLTSSSTTTTNRSNSLLDNGSNNNYTRNTATTTTRTTTTLTFDAFKEHMREVNQGSTTVHDIWGRMLCEIPGLGPDAVAAILHAYPVPKLLWDDYRKALQNGIASGRGGVVVAEALLVGLRGENGGRAIGPDKAKKVFQALFMNHWNLATAV